MTNDRELFEWHVMRHLDAAYNLARWYLNNDADAEDASQEAILKAYEAFAGFRGVDGKPWLMQIVRNVCLRHLEKRKRVRLEPIDDFDVFEPVGGEGDPEGSLLRAADAQAVREAVMELPEFYREVLILREFEDMSYAEISEVVGVPVGTVMSRLSRGRAQLAQRLREVATT